MLDFVPKNIFVCELSETLLQHEFQKITEDKELANRFPGCSIYPIVVDEEFWPFQPECFDLVLSNLNMHWVNDLSIGFSRIQESLQPDGKKCTAVSVLLSDSRNRKTERTE